MTTTIRLEEYAPRLLTLSRADEDYLRAGFGKQFDIGPRLSDDTMLVSSQQHVGVLELPSGTTLICEPKVPVRNLFQMMAKAYGLDQDFRDEITSLDRLEDLIEFVILQFVSLVEARIQRGLYRTYVEVEDNLAAIRGRIDFNGELRHNLILRHRVYCRYSEFSHDIPENQIIRQVVHRLVRWVSHAELRVRLDGLDALLSEITPTHLPVSALDQMHYHRLNDDYEPIHQLCRLFLEGASIDENTGEFSFNTFLIDMNRLFERFVGAVLHEHAPTISNVATQDEAWLDVERRVRMRLDLVLRTDGQVRVIADTKYKRLDSYGPGQADLYQVLAYCTALAVERGLLIYPRHMLHIAADTIRIRNSPVSISLLSVNLGVPFEQFDAMCAETAARCWELALPNLVELPTLVA